MQRVKLIGVNSAIYSETGGFMGIGLAMPIKPCEKSRQPKSSVGDG